MVPFTVDARVRLCAPRRLILTITLAGKDPASGRIAKRQRLVSVHSQARALRETRNEPCNGKTECSVSISVCGYTNCTDEPDGGGRDCASKFDYCKDSTTAQCTKIGGCCHGCWSDHEGQGVGCVPACQSPPAPGHCSQGGCDCSGGGAATCNCAHNQLSPCRNYGWNCQKCNRATSATCNEGTFTGKHAPGL